MWVLILGLFIFLSAVFLWLSLVLDPRGRVGGLGKNLGVLVRNLKTMRVVQYIGLMFVRVLVPAHTGCPG